MCGDAWRANARQRAEIANAGEALSRNCVYSFVLRHPYIAVWHVKSSQP